MLRFAQHGVQRFVLPVVAPNRFMIDADSAAEQLLEGLGERILFEGISAPRSPRLRLGSDRSRRECHARRVSARISDALVV